VPEAKTIGPWGIPLEPAAIQQIHERIVHTRLDQWASARVPALERGSFGDQVFRPFRPWPPARLLVFTRDGGSPASCWALIKAAQLRVVCFRQSRCGSKRIGKVLEIGPNRAASAGAGRYLRNAAPYPGSALPDNVTVEATAKAPTVPLSKGSPIVRRRLVQQAHEFEKQTAYREIAVAASSRDSVAGSQMLRTGAALDRSLRVDRASISLRV